MTRSNLRTLATAAMLAVAGSLPAAAQGAKLIPVTVGYDGYSMTTGPMNYGKHMGIFKKYGLDVTLKYIASGTILTQAVIGGSVEIAQNGYTPAIASEVRGSDVVLIGGISNKLPFQMVVKGSIKNAHDLIGKKVAISHLGSSTDTAATIAIKHLGLNKSQVHVLQLGGAATRAAALLSGQIDGAMEQYPRTAALEAKGFHVLVDCTTIAGDYPNTAYVTTRSYLSKHREAVKRFMMAIADSVHQFKTHKAEAMKLTAAFLKVPNNKALGKTYDLYSQKIYPDVPLPSLKGIQIVLNSLKAKHKMPQGKSFKPEQLVDTSAIQQLEKEGFFHKLLKK